MENFNTQATEAVPQMSLYNKSPVNVYTIQVDAFACKYALSPEVHMEPSQDKWPIINNTWFLGSLDLCKSGAQSHWYTTVYDQNFTINDLPGGICIPLDRCFSVDETRGYVWFHFFSN